MRFPTTNIKGIRLERVARIPTPEAAVFYTLKELNDGTFEAFYRQRYDTQVIGRCLIDPTTWNIIEDHGAVCPGEDPRSLTHQGIDYLVDNSWGSSSLIIPEDDYRVCRLPSKGKNLTLISHGRELLCIEWLRPLSILSTIASPYPENWKRLGRERANDDYTLRGGTPGYGTPKEGVYVGFGHRTIASLENVTHTPFAWRLDCAQWELLVEDVAGKFERPITDPTCVIQHDGRLFLVTAESHLPWFGRVQEFFTCVDEIKT